MASKIVAKILYYCKLLRLSLVYQTKEFFHNSTLHGVRYIAETSRPFGERFMWFLFTATGTIAALVIIASLWDKFQTNPTITGLDTDFHNQRIVFPTILVCPNKAYDEESVTDVAYNLLSDYNSETSPLFEPYLKFTTQVNYENLVEFWELATNATKISRSILKHSIRDLASLVPIKCENVFAECSYRDDELDCCQHFKPMYTEQGFCYGFNMKYRIQDKNHIEKNTYILELLETDKKWNIMFLLQNESRVFIHSHYETSGFDTKSQLTWNGNSADLLISMKQTITTEDAKQLSISQRKCIFPDEVHLDFFVGEYTFTNCMIECRIKLNMELCNCIPPFYPAFPSTKYCRLSDFQCLVKNLDNITDVRSCSKCELSCYNVVYEVDKLGKSQANDLSQDSGYINIEYLTWPIIRYKREILFGWVDLLVSFGGIAGLFLGFSLLSGVEIIYFFTLRTVCMIYKDRQVLEDIDKNNSSSFIKKLKGRDLTPDFKKSKSMTNLTTKNPTKLLLFDTTNNMDIIHQEKMLYSRHYQNRTRMQRNKKVGPYQQKIPENRAIFTINIRARSEDPPQFQYLP